MNNEQEQLKRIIGKSFRKAGRWYIGYICCQLAILVFVMLSIFIQLTSNLSAVVAFLGVLATEGFRWRSDHWKSEGESAKRRWEMVDGFGVAVNSTDVADWLAARPKDFLGDVEDDELRRSEFDSTKPPGAERAVENIQESAWWSKHECRRMVGYLGVLLVVIVTAAFVALAVSIAGLKPTNISQSGTVVQNVGGVICSVLMFVFSLNLVRLLFEYWTFAAIGERIFRRCCDLAKSFPIPERDALSVMHDYQSARGSAPHIPTFVWKCHEKHLREQWAGVRPQRPGGSAQ